MLTERGSDATSILVKNWIQDLVNIGMSYSRLSARLKLSPSTINKIAKKNRTPRAKTLKAIGEYYLKIFENPQSYNLLIMNYASKNAGHINEMLLKTRKLVGWVAD